MADVAVTVVSRLEVEASVLVDVALLDIISEVETLSLEAFFFCCTVGFFSSIIDNAFFEVCLLVLVISVVVCLLDVDGSVVVADFVCLLDVDCSVVVVGFAEVVLESGVDVVGSVVVAGSMDVV